MSVRQYAGLRQITTARSKHSRHRAMYVGMICVPSSFCVPSFGYSLSFSFFRHCLLQVVSCYEYQTLDAACITRVCGTYRQPVQQQHHYEYSGVIFIVINTTTYGIIHTYVSFLVFFLFTVGRFRFPPGHIHALFTFFCSFLLEFFW